MNVFCFHISNESLGISEESSDVVIPGISAAVVVVLVVIVIIVVVVLCRRTAANRNRLVVKSFSVIVYTGIRE